MDPRQGRRSDAWVALAVTLAVNAGLLWGLSRMMTPRWPATTASGPTLSVVWITRAPPRDDTIAVPTRVPRVTPPRPGKVIAHTENTKPTANPTPDPPAQARALSAVYLMQARQAAADAAVTAPRDPLGDRRVRLPGEGQARFRMKPQASAATVVASVGRMFGARDPDEPCHEHRRNIDALALAGDSAALQDQLDYERRFCRP